ncbi:thioredoxin family protein [uncultured Muriicola sp.]|uniref:thioredoxin family protein n=1 Tax=uncultured Muriicola sp. TaxID=1583102 RepID=UPI00261F8110|nr:thioredoxin family protein [uncultured Muriicola sp.]
MNNTLTEHTTKDIIHKAISKSMSYAQFRELVSKLAANNGTTGPEQTEDNKHYTVLNDKRMRRWDKTLKILEEVVKQLTDYQQKVYWLVITESWCGDSAPSLPVMNKIASYNDRIDLKIVLRNEHPKLMDAFLTNEKMAIPKLIVIDQETSEVLGTWGPLPTKATIMANEYRQKHGALSPEFKEELQQWFNKDKGQNILNDFQKLLALK